MAQARIFHDPPVARWLFGSTSLSWLWLLVRAYVGWQWLTDGWVKFNDPAWMQTGEALRAHWQRILLLPDAGRDPAVAEWYRALLERTVADGHYVWWAKVIVLGEQAVGIALLLGAFTGLAAAAAAIMSWNLMLTGSVSGDPALFVLAVLLMLAWKTAGFYGLDHWLLPALGPTLQPGEAAAPDQRGNPDRQPVHSPHP